MKKVVYVTGCLGFIGYHVTEACLKRGWYVYGIDSLTYASNLNLLDDLKKYSTFTYVTQDINDIERLFDCDYVINTAAETHVDNSIASSEVFLKSNINGVHKLLELIKEKPKSRRPILLHFSTDEVYGDIKEGFHVEKDLLKPSNPYSATKAAADMLVIAWARTYDIPYVIVRPTNNYGIGQYVEKFIPKAIKNLTLERPIVMHDNGEPIRTWLHVKDTASAVTTIIDTGVVNETYNISGNYEEKNIVVAKKIIDIFNHYNEQGNKDTDNIIFDYEFYMDFSEKRQGQDVRYAIDDSKLKALGWKPKANFDDELLSIVQYYRKHFIW
jgi:dTDP-glucose 4,6-dehydratase